ncbi:MAG: pyrophosphatase PpaX [Clostridia bacterium]|nr:pyrophosphatase PpaX [Clostridia bacterium]
MPYAGVLFDFDGTLVDTTDLVIESFQYTLRPYLGREVKPEEVYPFFGAPLREGLFAFVPDKAEELLPVYRRYTNEHFEEKIKLCPGVREGLGRLKKAGLKLGVVTSRMRKTTLRGLEIFDLLHFFVTVVALEDVDNHKPGPEPVRKALRDLGVAAEDAIMIGDSPLDILAARAAGVKSAAAGWSAVPRARLLAAEPDFSVESMEEFVEICLAG